MKLLISSEKHLVSELISHYINHNENLNIEIETVSEIPKLEDIGNFDIILFDLPFNEEDKSKIIKQINFLPVRKDGILILFTNLNSIEIKSFFKAGINGAISSYDNTVTFDNAIASLMKGEKFISPSISNFIIEETIEDETDTSKQGLTLREREILKLILLEYNNTQIADKLFISRRTVESHKRNILKKTSSKNLIGVFRYLIRENLVDELLN